MPFEKYAAIAEEHTHVRVVTEAETAANYDVRGVSKGGDSTTEATGRCWTRKTRPASESAAPSKTTTASESAAAEAATHLGLR